MKQNYSSLIKNIKHIRVGKSYSQEYVAAKLKISQNSYSKLELGYVPLTVIKLIEIANILEIDYHDLMRLSFDVEKAEIPNPA